MWTEDEIQFLFNNPAMSIPDIARRLGKTPAAVRGKRSRLGIRSTDAKKPWTRDERNLLAQNYERGRDELLKLFPDRSWDAIRSQAAWLRKRQWSI